MPGTVDAVSGQGAANPYHACRNEGALPKHEESEGTDDEAVVETQEGNRGGGTPRQPHQQDHPAGVGVRDHAQGTDQPDAKI